MLPMSPHPEPWNRIEPMAVALERHGLAKAYNFAIDNENGPVAIRLLKAVGVDEANARRMVDLAIRVRRSG